jgi:hypothetical protein
MGRRRQINVALDDAVRERLETLAKELGRSVGDEIRHRIERTLQQDQRVATNVFISYASGKSAVDKQRAIEAEIATRLDFTLNLDQFDEPTRDLAYDLMVLARHIKEISGFAWHKHPKATEALIAAMQAWLEAEKPENAAGEFPDEPRTLGRTLAATRRREEEVQTAVRREHPRLTQHLPRASQITSEVRELAKQVRQRVREQKREPKKK